MRIANARGPKKMEWLNWLTLAKLPESIFDVYRFIVVPHQVTDQSTFVVEAITDMINPTAAVPDTIFVNTSDSNAEYTASAVDLTFPVVGGVSTSVMRATVNLVEGDNVIQIKDTPETITIKRRSAGLNVVTATNSTELNTALVAALENGTATDVIEIDYDGCDIPVDFNQLNLVNVRNNTSRNSWLTVKPASGRTVNWTRSSGAWSAQADWICFEGMEIGSSTDTEQGNSYIPQPGSRVWLKDCNEEYQWRYNYVDSGGRTGLEAQLPDSTIPGQRLIPTLYNRPSTDAELYWTGGTIKGSASLRSGFNLIRDVYYDEVRSDMCANTTVFVNSYVTTCAPITVFGATDTTHLDLLQFWGTERTGIGDYQNIIAAGLKVSDEARLDGDGNSVPTQAVQTCLFDRTYGTTRRNVFIKDIETLSIENYNNFWQFAGNIINTRIDNVSMASNGFFIYRSDFDNPDNVQQFKPINVYVGNINVDKHSFAYQNTANNESVYWDTVENDTNVTAELNQASEDHDYQGRIVFYGTNGVTPAPPYVTLGALESVSSALTYRCSVIPPDQLIYDGMTRSSFSYYFYPSDRLTSPFSGGGMAMSFDDAEAAQAAEDAAIAAGSTYRLTITLGSNPSSGTEGDVLVYETTTPVASGNVGTELNNGSATTGITLATPTSSSSSRFIPADQWTLQTTGTGRANFLDGTEDWGDNPLLVVTIL